MTTCRDKVRPGLIPFYEVVKDVEPGKGRCCRSGYARALMFIPFGTTTKMPISFASERKVASRRQKNSADSFQQRGTFRAELRPVSGCPCSRTWTSADSRTISSRIRQQDVPADDDEAAWTTLLFNTEIMVEDGITVVGILLFGRTPNRFLPQAGIDATAFPGVSKEYAARERSVLARRH
jgi:ATP-dependent DNA helicase RecG